MDFLTSLVNSMPGAVAQGLIWGIMAIGVYITYRTLDVAVLTVDGSLGTGGAGCVVLVRNGVPVGVALVAATLAGMLAGLVTGLFHTACGIPAILAGILTQLALYSVNLRIMGTGTGGGKANLPISVDKYGLLVSARYVRALALNNPIIVLLIFCAILIGVRLGGIGFGYAGGAGVLVLGHCLGMKPGNIPWDVILIIASVMLLFLQCSLQAVFSILFTLLRKFSTRTRNTLITSHRLLLMS